MTVAKQVDPGPGRSAPRERSLVIDATSPRRGEPAQLGETSRAPLLGKPEEVHEHLGGGFGVWESAVAGRCRNAEEVRERGEADAPDAAFEQAARKRSCAERRLGETATLQHEELPLEEALVEAGVVSDKECVCGKGQEAGKHLGGRRSASKLPLPEARQAGDGFRKRNLRIDER